MDLSYFKSKASVLLKIPQVNALRGVPLPQYSGEDAQILLARKIEEGKGCLIARVGETEGRATTHFLRRRIAMSQGRIPYDAALMSKLRLLAGYFPVSNESIDELAKLYLSAVANISIYAAWTPHDAWLCPQHAIRIRLIDLDPFFTERKWTLALEGRKVCVVSPFIDTMQIQYPLRNKYFKTSVIPDMELSYVRAPMTQCETDVTDQSWQNNLHTLTDAVLRTDAEVIIIGAGAYGLPLGSNAAKQGKVAIVLGGSTQLLFGIKGTRWENDRQYRAIFNDHWVRPSETERPPGFQNFEIKGGAYW